MSHPISASLASPADARALLGVEPGATAEQIRRAYLRRVKAVRPERDPEGFKALRQAFESLRDGTPRSDPPGDARSAEPAVLRSGDAPKDARSDEPAVLHSGGSPTDAADPLLEVWPEHVAHLRVLSAEAALGSDDYDRALALLEGAVTAAEAQRFTGAPLGLIGVCLEMIDRDDPPDAAPLAARWMTVVDEAGELLRLPSELAALALLSAELIAIWPGLHHEIAAPIAAALSSNDLDRAEAPIRAFAEEHPRSAASAGELMADKAPRLLGVYRSALYPHSRAAVSPPRAADERSNSGSLPGWAWWVLFFMLMKAMPRCAEARPEWRGPPRVSSSIAAPSIVMGPARVTDPSIDPDDGREAAPDRGGERRVSVAVTPNASRTIREIPSTPRARTP